MPNPPKDLVLVDDRDPWEKQPHESRQAFANFCLYRDLGPRRSLQKAADESPRSLPTFKDQSRKNRWVERAEAYDDFMDARYRDAREGEIVRRERQEAQLGVNLTAIAAARILGNESQNIPAISARDLDAGEAVRMAEAGIRIRRLAMGQPTDIMRGHHTITADDLKRAAEGVYEILMRYVPEDRQPRAAQDVERFLETGRIE